MPSADLVANAIVDYLNGNKGIVVVLSGSWGSGKSYLWKEKIAGRLKRRAAAVSLFGVEEVRALRSRVAFATTKDCAEQTALVRLGEVVSTWRRMVAQVPKLIGQVADSNLGTSIFAGSVDLLELVPEGSVICLDDVERAGRNVSMQEILGVVSFLCEERRASVLLIMDDEQLAAHSDEFRQDFLRFKERVVRAHVRLDADLASVADTRIAGLDVARFAPENCTTALVASKLLAPFLAAGNQNLRTLIRSLELLRHLLDRAAHPVPVDLASCISALVLEEAAGVLLDADFYQGSLSLLFLVGDDRAENPYSKFLGKYFPGDLNGFRFRQSVYALVRDGILDLDRFNAETAPSDSQALTAAQRLSAFTQESGFFFATDEEYACFIKEAEDILRSDTSLTVEEVVVLYGYAGIAADRTGVSLRGDLLSVASERVKSATPDDGGRFMAFRYSDLSQYVGELLDVYRNERAQVEERELVDGIESAIRRNDAQELRRRLRSSLRDLRVATTNPGTFDLVIRSEDRPFSYQIMATIVEALNAGFPASETWISDARHLVASSLSAAIAATTQKSERWRLTDLQKRCLKWIDLGKRQVSDKASGATIAADGDPAP